MGKNQDSAPGQYAKQGIDQSFRMRNDKKRIFKRREHVSFGREPSRGMNSALSVICLKSTIIARLSNLREVICVFPILEFEYLWTSERLSGRQSGQSWTTVKVLAWGSRGLLLPPALPTKTSSSPPSPQHTPSQTDNHKVTTPITVEHESYPLFRVKLNSK